MSKAFVNEDAGGQSADAEALPVREQTLPITPGGYARLKGELDDATHDPSQEGVRRVRALTRVLETVEVVEPSVVDGRAAFGSRVTFEDEEGERTTYVLVGPDEVDMSRGHISAHAPVARALLGKQAGDEAQIRRPKGEIDVTIVHVDLPDDAG